MKGRTGTRLLQPLLVASLVVVLGLAAADSDLLALAEKRLEDAWSRLLGEKTPDDRIAIIEIDDQTLEHYFPEIPLPRGQIALLLDRLAGPIADAKTVVFDLYFEGPDKLDPAWDTLLSLIIADHRDRMIGAMYLADVRVGAGASGPNMDPLAQIARFSYGLDELRLPQASATNLPLDILLNSADFYGHINVYQDETGVFRELPLFIRCDGSVIGALAIEALVNYLDIERTAVWAESSRLHLGEHTVPFGDLGSMKIQHFGPMERFTHYSLLDLLDQFENGQVTPDMFRDKIVLVGLSSRTYYPNEYSFSPQGYERPNVYAHADIMSSILSDQYLEDVPKSVLPVLAIILGLLFTSGHLLKTRLLRLLISVGCILALLLLDLFLFREGLCLRVVPLLSMAVLLTVYTYFVSYREQEDIIRVQEQETFSLRRKEQSLVAIEEEIRVARAIQEHLLPQSAPEIAGYELYGVNLPAKGISGDFYDFVPVADGQWVIIVADVSGKGISASLLMAASQAVLRAESLKWWHESGKTSDAVMAANDLIHAITSPSHFVTLFYSVLDSESGVISYVNAGHNPPFRAFSNHKVERLGAGDLILGVAPGIAYQTQSITLEPGEKLVMFTDGVGDALNSDGEEYGEERLMALVAQSTHLKAQQMVEAITGDIRDFTGNTDQADDITVVVLGRTGDVSST